MLARAARFIAIVSGHAKGSSAARAASSSSMADSSCALKSVGKVMPEVGSHWVGDGFHVQSVFGNSMFTNEISPFLLFDYAHPRKFEPTRQRLGVGTHPHRGFETVTLALQGEVEHADSTGAGGVITQGGVQWMTAGRGIIHEEYHSTDFAKKGGTFEMCQLWVNLPKKEKMIKPSYQALDDGDIPRLDFDGGYVRVIAGKTGGVAGAAKTHTPVTLFHVVSKDGGYLTLDSPKDHNAIVFVARGQATIKDVTLQQKKVAKLQNDGDQIGVQLAPGSQLVVMGGMPLDEPIAAQGPFVMNTQAEIRQAAADFYAGKFGQ